MARHLNPSGAGVSLILLAGSWLALAGLPARAAEPLADPTMPPASVSSPAARSGARVSTGPVLQSILVSAARKSAIISGERIELGERYGPARLVQLTDATAVLEGPQGRTVLRLVADVETRPAAPQDRGAVREGSTGVDRMPKTKGDRR